MAGFMASRGRVRARLAPLSLAVAIAVAAGGAHALPAAAAERELDADVNSLPTAAGPSPAHCANSSDALARADELLANIYRLGSNVAVQLPADLTWAEDPLHDRNWQFQLHSLGYVRDLLTAWTSTGGQAYLDRAIAIVQDWLADNPKADPPSEFSWGDHSTAWRGYAMSCLAEVIDPVPWLNAALDLHGQTLADPAFYVKVGNHALDQANALLEIGRVRGRPDWTELAATRINGLVAASVDVQGVTNEQSIGYQFYNYRRYMAVKGRLLAAGLTPAPAFARVDRMPAFLAHATLPNGQYEMLGDTLAYQASSIPGTTAEFAATLGASGPRPAYKTALYDAGYFFGRTGWGTARPYKDEVCFTLNWGPPAAFHGHHDGLGLTLYGFGTRLLVDPGGYSYDRDAWRAFFKSRGAHNVVTVDGLTWSPSAPTTLLGHVTAARSTYTRLQTKGYPGVTHIRKVVFSRWGGYLIVEDRLTATTSRTFRQLWHLPELSYPRISGAEVLTNRTRGNVLIRQLAGTQTWSIVKAQTAPIQGWISYFFKKKVGAPVAGAAKRGTSVRYITLIVPSAGAPKAVVRSFSTTATGYSLTIDVNGRTERVVVTSSAASITTP